MKNEDRIVYIKENMECEGSTEIRYHDSPDPGYSAFAVFEDRKYEEDMSITSDNTFVITLQLGVICKAEADRQTLLSYASGVSEDKDERISFEINESGVCCIVIHSGVEQIISVEAVQDLEDRLLDYLNEMNIDTLERIARGEPIVMEDQIRIERERVCRQYRKTWEMIEKAVPQQPGQVSNPGLITPPVRTTETVLPV